MSAAARTTVRTAAEPATDRPAATNTSMSTRLRPLLALSPLLLGAGTPLLPGHVGPGAAAGSVASVTAARADFDKELRELQGLLVSDLEQVADACQKVKAFLQRNRVYELILEYDPEHKNARKFLGYKYDRKAEEWTMPRKPRDPKDASDEAVAEAAAERVRILGGHRQRMLQLLDAHPDLPLKLKNRELKRLVALLPDDAELRGMRREVRSEGEDGTVTWVLEESLRGNKVHKENEALLKKMKSGAPTPTEEPLEDWEKELGAGFLDKAAVTDRVRVVGNASTSENETGARMCHIIWDYLEHLFGIGLEPSYTSYHIEGRSAKSSFLGNWPGLDPDQVEYLKGTGGSTLSGREMFQSGPTSDNRIDGSVRMSIAMYMGRNFGVGSSTGWAIEGFGMYITHQLLGTRLTYFIRRTDYVQKGKKRDLQDPNSNWMKMALEVLTDEKPFNLPFAMGRDVNNLTPDDLLVSYALAAYLLEGCEPETATTVLSKMGTEGVGGVQAVEETLGFDIETVRDRLAQWLQERD